MADRPPVPPAPNQSSIHEKLVGSLVALEVFLTELRGTSGRREILALTLKHVRSLVPITTAGFFFPEGADFAFKLQTPLSPAEAAQLAGLVDQAIDSGVFGWALKHSRPAAFKSSDGETTLILAALRTHQRLVGMLAAILNPQLVSGWDVNHIVLATHLACAADAILTEELTLELQAHNRKLDALVTQRTEQLLQAKEAAELANRAKSSFLAAVSHELRTPLNAVLGYTQILLQDQRLLSEQQSQIQTIYSSSKHLLALINDLLDISKAEASAIEIVPELVGLRKLLREAVCIVLPRAEEKALHFQCWTDARLPEFITVDAKRLKQVLLNLLSNAIKFTDQGAVHLDVSRAHDRVRFLVRDTGSGIAPEDLPKLFQPFQQLTHAARSMEGTGLGLSVCKKILDTMGVELRVRSQLGEGSSFWFELPCAAGAAESPAPATSLGPEQNVAEKPRLTTALPLGVLRGLKQLAARGDVLELQSELEGLMAKAGADDPLGARLLQLAAACKLKAFRDLLDQYERNHPDC